MVSGFHKTIEKGCYESIHGGTTLGVMGVLIEKRACLGVIERDLACHALTQAKIARAHQPYPGGGAGRWQHPRRPASPPRAPSECERHTFRARGTPPA